MAFDVAGTTGGCEAEGFVRQTCEFRTVCMRSRARRARCAASTRSVTFAELVRAVVKTVTTPKSTIEPMASAVSISTIVCPGLGAQAGREPAHQVHTEVPEAFLAGMTGSAKAPLGSVLATETVAEWIPSSTQTFQVPNGMGTSDFRV